VTDLAGQVPLLSAFLSHEGDISSLRNAVSFFCLR
jgi:hypothetical protein